MTFTQRIIDLRKAYLAAHNREANVIHISHADEYEVGEELPGSLKSEAFTKGVRAVLPTVQGLRVYWDAEITRVDFEEPLPILLGYLG